LRIKYYPTVKALFPKGELECVPCHDFKNPCEHFKHLPTLEQPVGGKCMFLLTSERIISTVKEMIEK